MNQEEGIVHLSAGIGSIPICEGGGYLPTGFIRLDAGFPCARRLQSPSGSIRIICNSDTGLQTSDTRLFRHSFLGITRIRYSNIHFPFFFVPFFLFALPDDSLSSV